MTHHNVHVNTNSQFSLFHGQGADNLNILKDIANGDFSRAKEYSGFGGLKGLFNNNTVNQLKGYFSDDEISSLIKASTTAYYTPDFLVDFIYQLVGKLGFTGGKILEPACGSGIFFDRMPQNIKDNSQITGVEIDKISADIAAQLYPDVSIVKSGFEDFNDNGFDLVIGNPPYGSMMLSDPKHPDLKQAIHHFFLGKSIRLLKDGGLLAMVLPTYILDNRKNHLRDVIKKEAEIVTAYRLPDTLFQNAKVTVDIVVFKKSTTGNNQWADVQKVQIKNGQCFFMSQYFIDNPQNIIGQLDSYKVWRQNDNRYREGLKCSGTAEQVKAKIPELMNQLKPQTIIKEPIKKVSNLQTKLAHFENQLNQMLMAIHSLRFPA